MDIQILSCDSDGNAKFKYENHVITSNLRKMFKWHSETIDKTVDKQLKNDVDDQMLLIKRVIDKGARKWKEKR